MFFHPKNVVDLENQVKKYWSAFLWWKIIPILPLFVFWSNLLNYLWDGFTQDVETYPELKGTFPSMYTNELARLCLSELPLWGPFVYYDMFSWAGFFNFVEDAIWMDIGIPIVGVVFFVLEMFNVYERS